MWGVGVAGVLGCNRWVGGGKGASWSELLNAKSGKTKGNLAVRYISIKERSSERGESQGEHERKLYFFRGPGHILFIYLFIFKFYGLAGMVAVFKYCTSCYGIKVIPLTLTWS